MSTTPEDPPISDHDEGDAAPDFDELANRAGAALRRPAPKHGVTDIARRGQRRQVARALTAGGVVVVLIAVGVVVATRDSRNKPLPPIQTTTPPVVTTTPPIVTTALPVVTTIVDLPKPIGTLSVKTVGAQFMPDGRVLVDLGNGLMLWDVATGQQGDTFAQDQEKIISQPWQHNVPPELSRDGTQVFHHDALWETQSGRLVTHVIPGLPAGTPYGGLAFGPIGTAAVLAQAMVDQGRVSIFDTQTVVLGPRIVVRIESLGADDRFLLDVSISPDGTKIVTSGADTPSVSDAKTGAKLLGLDADAATRSPGVPRSPGDDLVVAMFSPDGTKLLTVRDTGTVRLRDATTGALLSQVVTAVGPTMAFFSPDGKTVLIIHGDAQDNVGSPRYTANVLLWHVEIGQPERALATVSRTSSLILGSPPAVFSPDGTKLVTANGSTATVWDVATGRALGTLSGHTADILSTAFSPDGSRIVTASDDGSVKVWLAP